MRNFIGSIISEHGIIKLIWEVKQEVKRHFSDKYLEPDHCRPILEGIHFKSMSSIDFGFLEERFSDLEIK